MREELIEHGKQLVDQLVELTPEPSNARDYALYEEFLLTCKDIKDVLDRLL